MKNKKVYALWEHNNGKIYLCGTFGDLEMAKEAAIRYGKQYATYPQWDISDRVHRYYPEGAGSPIWIDVEELYLSERNSPTLYPNNEYIIAGENIIHRSAIVSDKAIVDGVVIGPAARVGAEAYLYKSNIGKGTTIQDRARIGGFDIGPDCYIGYDSAIDADIGHSTFVGSNSAVSADIGPNSHIGNNVRVYYPMPEGARADDNSNVSAPAYRAYHVYLPAGGQRHDITLMDTYANVDGETRTYEQWGRKLPEDSPIRLLFKACGKI